jgi:hypothetical protein
LAKKHGERFQPPELLKSMAKKGEAFYPGSRPAAKAA